MKKHTIIFTICFLMLGICGTCFAQDSGGDIEIQITINDIDKFSTNEKMGVVIKNEDDLIAEENNLNCSRVSKNSETQKLKGKCPEGFKIQQVEPERHFFDTENCSLISLLTSKLEVNKRYEITVGGLSLDESRMLIAKFTGVVDKDTLKFEVDEWDEIVAASRVRKGGQNEN